MLKRQISSKNFFSSSFERSSNFGIFIVVPDAMDKAKAKSKVVNNLMRSQGRPVPPSEGIDVEQAVVSGAPF